MPSCRATSAAAIPKSWISWHTNSALIAGSAPRRLPLLRSVSDTPFRSRPSAVTRSIRPRRRRTACCRSLRFSASSITRSTNSPLPKILSSDACACCLCDLTSAHPPADRTSPPSTSSGRCPSATPSSTKRRYAALAWPSRPPNCARTLRRSCQS